MNIEQAKKIPLAQILEIIGCKPVREKPQRATYLSPLRLEKTASFHVHNARNLWYDFGIDKGGSVVDFVCAYLQSCNESGTLSDALRWLANMTGSAPAIRPIPALDDTQEDTKLTVKNAKPIRHPLLIKYLEDRGIPLSIASCYITELLIHNDESKKDFFALGFVNEEGGFEIRNPFLKGCVGSKTISFIRGKKPKPKGIHLFEGFIDYVSAITHNKVSQFDGDTIVLNSLSCLKYATPYIKNYGYRVAYTWLDNDPAGEKATDSLCEFFKTEESLQHKPMNKFYLPHKDVNAWHMRSLSLSP